MILGTAGHIDHGKTALVRALTGVDTDRLPEEKRRGITIELGFAPLTIDGVGTVGVVDVPGHEAFVRTMVAGASGIDIALLVVAADEGPMPQTREHVAILRLLRIPRLVVALTKADLVDGEWMALVRDDVHSLVASAGFPDAPIAAVSSVSGAGIDELRDTIRQLARSAPDRDARDLFRLPIDRVFTMRGTGTVVTGTVWSGSLTREAIVRILPQDTTARIRSLQTHSRQVERISPGNRAAVALVGVEVGDVARGSVLVADSTWVPTRRLRAEVTLSPDAERTIRPRTEVRFHLGTAEVGARLLFSAVEGAAAGPLRSIRVSLDEPIVARGGDRFVLRSPAPLDTIGGGVITDAHPPPRPRRWPAGLDAEARLDRVVLEAGATGVDVNALPTRLGLPAEAVDQILANDRFARRGPRAWNRGALDGVAQRVPGMVRSFHDSHPLEPGIPVQLLRTSLTPVPELAELAIDARVRAGEVQVLDGVARVPGWQPALSGPDQAVADRVSALLTTAGWEAPSANELIPQFGPSVPSILRFMERLGSIVQVEEGRYYTTGNLKSVIERIREATEGESPRSPAEIREAVGLSRKFLIPLLEYCDRRGLTVRHGDGRVWRR